MIKKIIPFLLVLFLASNFISANDWGVFDNYEDEIEKYAMYKVLNEIPIKYAIEILPEASKEGKYINKKNEYEEVSGELKNYLEEQKKISELESLVETAFIAWPRDTHQMIFKEERKEEFADIYPLLSKILSNRLSLKKVEDRKKADIVFIFSSKQALDCHKTAAACIDLNIYPIEVKLVAPYDINELKGERKIKLLSDIIHEIGHYFALVDQYEDAGDASAEYSTFNRIGKDDSIMATQTSYALACDDIDGFINLMDITLHLQNNKWSDRAQNGWASFCNGRKNGNGKMYQEEFYRKAKLINKPDRVNGMYKQTFDEQGNLINTFIFDPLDLYGKEVKPSIVGYGMAGEIFDRENNRKYSCAYNYIGKGIIDIWETLTYEKFEYVREDLGGISWGCNHIDNNNVISVGVSFYDEKCRLFNLSSFGKNMINFNIELTDNNEFSSIHYDITDISLYNKNIKAKYPSNFALYEEKNDLICSVKGDLEEVSFLKFSLKNSGRIKIVKKDKEQLSEFAREYKVSEEEVINNAYLICNNMKAEANKEKYKYKCDYFRKVEKFYQSRASR